MLVKSYAKLNLYLAVLNKRKDKYHNLETLFERIDLCDTIILKSRRDNQIRIITNSSQIPRDRSNLAWRSAQLLKDAFKINRGLDIKIIKRIPVASGMAGGSSNAACVLTGLNKLWRLNLSRKRLVRFSKEIGADVPFFIHNTPFAKGSQRGDRVIAIDSLRGLRLWHVLIVPKIQVSTASVYQKWDKMPKKAKLAPPDAAGILKNEHLTGLTRSVYSVKLLTSALKRKDFALIGKALFNSLERVSLGLYPEIARAKQTLARLGLKSILMSGSGPAVLGIVSSRKEALSLARQLKRNRFWQVFVTRTV